MTGTRPPAASPAMREPQGSEPRQPTEPHHATGSLDVPSPEVPVSERVATHPGPTPDPG
jgi:hypothetical protein